MPQFTDILPTRISLLHKVQQNRHDPAWNELLEYYTPFVNKILLRMGLKNADLDDVRQLVLMRLWEGVESYKRREGEAYFRNWLSTLIRNSAINWFNSRKNKQMASIEDDGIEVISPEDSQMEKIITSEWECYVVELAMSRLQNVFSGKAFSVLALSLKGKTAEEIVEELNINLNSVYVLKSRVKRRLKQEIKSVRYDLEG